MYKLKCRPEDFYVKELMDVPILKKGHYSYYLLWKRNYNTLDAVRFVSKRFNIRLKYINISGNKDKHAITEQYISIAGGPPKDIKTKDLKLYFVGRGDGRLCLGAHEGNHFKIIVRNIQKTPKKLNRFRNLFDAQRFGKDHLNHEIGKAIVLNHYQRALTMIKSHVAGEHLTKSPRDYVGSLKMIPKSKLRFYVHAYQSWLWNDMARASTAEKLPLIGFNTELTPEVEKVLAKEGVGTLNFVNRQIPELSSEGAMRDVFADIKDLEISELVEDELNDNMHRVTLEFDLPKGAYATEAIKQLFK